MSAKVDRATQRDAMWDATERFDEFSAYDLSAAMHVQVEHAYRALKIWMQWGFVELVRVQRGKNFYRRNPLRAGQRPPRTDEDGRRLTETTPQERMWRVMRRGDSFTPLDLVMLASTPDGPVSEEEAIEFCRMLVLADYLRTERKAQAGNPPVYRLIQDTGPRPPRKRRVHGVYDENRDAFTYLAGGARHDR
ncbi:hypothetical protein [Litorisediminicola beolgyonensis]|uniref:DUF2087 domain-containing protein n=1 Tax=Litorisediminicola beolgyonensis TaxID=1173614 RepID=A0ABW3ZIF3_9RHOB